ncbi:MAG: MFS transporter [Candidatus Obscuribacterales bacterium]|nr:MFS transporter [Candidatus Obscuribacterales bacterium]
MQESQNSSRHSPAEKTSAPSLGIVLIGLQIALFLSALDQTILNIAIPRLSEILHGGDQSAWLITSYLLFSTVATPVAGKLADIFGVRTVISSATLLFAVTSLLCGLAGLVPIAGLGGMEQLIVARALQGTAGGAMLGLCFIAVGDLFSAQQRGRYQGFLAAAFIVAALAGPSLGGWLTESLNWRLIFLINVPLGLLSAALLARYPNTDRTRARASVDYIGIILFIVTVIPLLLASSDVGKFGSINAHSALLLSISVASFSAFLFREKNAKEPLVPLHLFSNRTISISLATVFITGVGLFGSMLLFAFMLQKLSGLSPVATGATLTPLMVVVAGASIAGGLLVSKTGKYKLLCLISLGSMALATALMTKLGPGFSTWQFMTYATAGGVALGLLLPVHSIIVQNTVTGSELGIATSMTQLFRSLGGTIGTGIMGALMMVLARNSTLHDSINFSLHCYAALLALAMVLNLFLPETPLKKKQK